MFLSSPRPCPVQSPVPVLVLVLVSRSSSGTRVNSPAHGTQLTPSAYLSPAFARPPAFDLRLSRCSPTHFPLARQVSRVRPPSITADPASLCRSRAPRPPAPGSSEPTPSVSGVRASRVRLPPTVLFTNPVSFCPVRHSSGNGSRFTCPRLRCSSIQPPATIYHYTMLGPIL